MRYFKKHVSLAKHLALKIKIIGITTLFKMRGIFYFKKFILEIKPYFKHSKEI